MAESSRASPAVYRSWRASPRDELPTKGAKRVRLAIFGFLALVLGVLLVWVLWPPGAPPVRFFSLPIIHYDTITVPPIPFIQEDAAALVQLAPDGVDLGDLETWAGISGLGKRFQETVGDRDTLVLYVTGHGVAQSGTACLLCSDYLWEPGTGRYKMDDLLEQVSRCRARVKLLILDADHLASDPRLGMLVNEFSRLVEEKVRSTPDPNLWVLMATQPLETPLASYHDKRSVFSYYVTAAFDGAADFNHDGVIDLAELVDFVNLGVKEYARRENGERATQSIRLLQGGKGAVSPPEYLVLAPFRRPAEDAEEAKPQNDAAAKPSDNVATSPSTSPTANELNKLLEEAWQLHDKIQDRGPTFAWSPVDYAPHLWRKEEAILLGYEARYRAGNAYVAQGLVEGLRPVVISLRETAELGRSGLVREGPKMGGPLAVARMRFLKRIAEIDGQESPDTKVFKSFVQLKNDLLFRLPSYLRWRACLAQTSLQKPRIDEPIDRLLERLPKFLDLLERLDKSKMDEEDVSNRQALWNDVIAQIEREKQTLQEDREKIKAALETDFQEVVDKPDKEGNAAKIEGLLATSLLSTPKQRIKLLKLLASFQAAGKSGSSLPLPPEPRSAYRPEPQPVAQWRQDRLREQAEFEIRLVRLADARFAEEILPPGHVLGQGGPESQEFWSEYRKLGVELGKFYQDLPEDLLKQVAAIRRGDRSETTRLSKADCMLRLVDARDVRDSNQIDSEVTLLAVRPFWTPPSAPREPEPQQPPMLPPKGPDRPILVVHRIGLPEGAITDPWIDDNLDCLRLRPFPNRVTSYRFDLVNRSGRERKVEVQLLATATFRGKRPADWQEPWDSAGNLRPGFQRLTEPVEVTLPGDPAPRAIPFSPPGTAKSGKDAGKLESGKGKEQESAKGKGAEPPPSVERGIVCAIRDSADKRKHWVRRIEFATLKPRSYLKPDVRYDARQEMITIDPRPVNPDYLPPLSEETPLTILWPTEGQIDADAEAKDSATIVAADDMPRLLAHVRPDPNRKVEVRLTVDNYPRAFLYTVPLDHSSQSPIPPEQEVCGVKITVPAQGQAYRVPLAESVPVEFQVDAPEDAFEEPGERVELRVLHADQNRELCPEARKQFFSDRQIDVRLTGFGPQGEVNIGTKVDNFKVVLPARELGGLKNIRARIHLQLFLPRLRDLLDPTCCEKDVGVVFDGSPPHVGELVVPREPVPQGEPVTGSLAADDLSGVKEVQYGFDLNQSGSLEPDEKPEKLFQRDSDDRWRFSLPTKDLKPGPYVVLVIVTDRVGLSSKRRASVMIAATRPDGGGEPPITESTLEGKVVLEGGGPLPDIEVRIVGTDLVATTDDAGVFKFPNKLKNGKYALVVKGSAKGREVAGSYNVTLPGKAEISLKW